MNLCADPGQMTLFVLDITEFKAMNEAYCEFMGDLRPARTCVQVRGPSSVRQVGMTIPRRSLPFRPREACSRRKRLHLYRSRLPRRRVPLIAEKGDLGP
jgi:hypothetical protein